MTAARLEENSSKRGYYDCIGMFQERFAQADIALAPNLINKGTLLPT